MSEEYKYCPKCRIINSPNAKVCECGYSFAEGGGLTEKELDALMKAQKQRHAIGRAVIVVLIITALLLGIKFGAIYIVLALFGAGVLFAVSTLIVGLKTRYERKHPKE